VQWEIIDNLHQSLPDEMLGFASLVILNVQPDNQLSHNNLSLISPGILYF
jgi:hypothetical protein